MVLLFFCFYLWWNHRWRFYQKQSFYLCSMLTFYLHPTPTWWDYTVLLNGITQSMLEYVIVVVLIDGTLQPLRNMELLQDKKILKAMKVTLWIFHSQLGDLSYTSNELKTPFLVWHKKISIDFLYFITSQENVISNHNLLTLLPLINCSFFFLFNLK